MRKIPRSFYTREDVLTISKELLGKVLVTNIEGKRTAGVIVETEAYKGAIDRASHAYGNRRTKRTEVMFGQGGLVYVYLCYGMHHLFNVITNKKEVAEAVLVRALEPLEGMEHMLVRRKMKKIAPTLTSGPGSLSQAMGINTGHYGLDLLSDTIWIEENESTSNGFEILESPRVGVDYAGEDAKLPYRFRVKGNRWVSPAK